MTDTTIGDLRASLGRLTVQRRTVPPQHLRAHDAAIFAVEQVLACVDSEPSRQQFRPTQYRPAPTQVHAGYAETRLATRVMP